MIPTEVERTLKEEIEYKKGGLYWAVGGRGRKVGSRVGTVDAGRSRRFTLKHGGKIHRFLEHRVIFWLHHGYWPEEVDHINRNPLDNRIENLRDCTSSQNKYNVPQRKNSSTGIKNVYWFKPHGMYKVQLQAEGKLRTVGYFRDIELAELVAQEARSKYHGDYAYDG